MRVYTDKNNKIVKDEDFVLVENEKVCQALRCDDGTLLYEEIIWDYNKGKIEISNEPKYPDAYDKNEIEIISYNKTIRLLRNKSYEK